MSVDLLDAPLRVSWDLCSDGQSLLNAEQLLNVGEQLTAAGVFYIALEDSPLAHPAIIDLITKLSAGGCQVTVSVSGSAAELKVLKLLSSSTAVLLDAATGIDSGQLNRGLLTKRLNQIRSLSHDPSLVWIPGAGELTLLPDLLNFCAENTIGRFKLLNQKISVNSLQNSRHLLPNHNDLEQLIELIEQEGLPTVAGLQLEVHDLFIWEVLQPLCGGERSEYGGCQAANSLGHIDHQGHLFPCSSWPQPIGSLLADNLLDLWQSSRRLSVRTEVASVPNGCDGCRDIQLCFGGCRGLSNFCRQDDSGRDLLCSAKR